MPLPPTLLRNVGPIVMPYMVPNQPHRVVSPSLDVVPAKDMTIVPGVEYNNNNNNSATTDDGASEDGFEVASSATTRLRRKKRHARDRQAQLTHTHYTTILFDKQTNKLSTNDAIK